MLHKTGDKAERNWEKFKGKADCRQEQREIIDNFSEQDFGWCEGLSVIISTQLIAVKDAVDER